jgi:lipopolysaccharide export system protein LptA
MSRRPGFLGPRLPLALLLAGGVAWLVWWNAPMVMGEAVQTQTKETAEGAEQRIAKIQAKGNVRIVRGEQTATAQEALYLREEEKIILTGDAKVWEGQNMVSGRQITLFLDEDTSLVEQEVKVIFYPKTKREESPSKGKAAKRNEPVVITAAKMRADHREKTVTFEQEVVVRREETTLYADHVTVFYQ